MPASNDEMTPDRYAKRARAQLNSIRSKPSTKVVWLLTGAEWRMVASLWLLIQRGVLIQSLEKKQLDRLRSAEVRAEADGYVRRHQLTIELAAKASDCEEDLELYHRIEAERPLLHG